jgi:hypothetical protein
VDHPALVFFIPLALVIFALVQLAWYAPMILILTTPADDVIEKMGGFWYIWAWTWFVISFFVPPWTFLNVLFLACMLVGYLCRRLRDALDFTCGFFEGAWAELRAVRG